MLTVTILFAALSFPFIFFMQIGIGNSMFPTMHTFTIVAVDRSNLDRNLTDQIVSYRYDNTLNIMHRVIEDDGLTLTVQGDNNPQPDPTVNRTQLIGVITYIFPQLISYLYISTLLVLGATMLIYMIVNGYYLLKRTKNVINPL